MVYNIYRQIIKIILNSFRLQQGRIQMKKTLVLINSTAGTGKAVSGIMEIVTKIAKKGNDPIIYPIIPGTGLVSENILKQHDGETDHVICSGGDGTLNHVLQGVMMMKNKPVIGYIPSGSTNDFAASLGLTTDFYQALDIAVNGKPFAYDAGIMNGKYFNYIAAFGAFSAVSYATKQQLKNIFGHAAYILTAAAELQQNISYSCHMKIEADSFEEEDDYVFGAVFNSLSVAGMKVPVTEKIRLNDGKMELVLIKSPKNFQELHFILNDMTRGNVDSPYITFRQLKNVRFISDENTAWSLDGEFGGKSSITEISVIPAAVSICTPGSIILYED